jgi:hypothetical protein
VKSGRNTGRKQLGDSARQCDNLDMATHRLHFFYENPHQDYDRDDQISESLGAQQHFHLVLFVPEPEPYPLQPPPIQD